MPKKLIVDNAMIERTKHALSIGMTRGIALAVSVAISVHGIWDGTVETIVKECGLTLKDCEDCDVDEFDMGRIRSYFERHNNP